MEKLKRLIIQLSNISNTEPLDKWNYFKTKRDINRIFFPLETRILKLEGAPGLGFLKTRTKYVKTSPTLNCSLNLLIFYSFTDGSRQSPCSLISRINSSTAESAGTDFFTMS